ncbi:MAG: hypothetical protein JO126_06360 [Alphaproteobacteria bacterium]|nr:hypothetical protein [Alphaproteobacteria bacterium]MBV8549061.1 hypothetical protein [Alphaproteobacteria bacterium]
MTADLLAETLKKPNCRDYIAGESLPFEDGQQSQISEVLREIFADILSHID